MYTWKTVVLEFLHRNFSGEQFFTFKQSIAGKRNCAVLSRLLPEEQQH